MNRLLCWLVTALITAPLVALGAPSVQPTEKKEEPARQGKLVFAATTGLEDLGTLSSSFRHARAAKEPGYLSDVVWLTYGRAVVSFDMDPKKLQPQAEVVPNEVVGLSPLVAEGHQVIRY